MKTRTLLCFCGALVFLAGCGTFRKTSTPRTALEQALISHSVEQSLGAANLEGMRGKTFTIDTDWVQAVDEEFILSAINRKLLESGMNRSADPTKADVAVYPLIGHAGTDDSAFLLGIPSLAIPVPFTSAPLQTPEVAIFKLDRAYGRTSLGLYGVDRDSGQLAFSIPLNAGEAYYKLWTILFLINFDTTNLPEPYN